MRNDASSQRKPGFSNASYNELIRQLVAARKRLHIPQDELAYRIGCTTSLVHKWEQHKRTPSAFMFICWLDALDCSVSLIEPND